MGHLKLLIVDDVEDNRLVLRAICRKVEGFEIQEAEDGIEAIQKVESWHPHIVLMDVMMPQMDGFEASKIIKERFPETIIMVITAVVDPHMEENFASIGVSTFIHKPIDKELIRFKLQSFGMLLRSKRGEHQKLSEKKAINPFCPDIRHFRTVFEINDSEGMMDFGTWILGRCDECIAIPCPKIDAALEFFYELMRYGTRDGQSLGIIVEENFEEIYVTMKFEETIDLKPKAEFLFRDLGEDCIVKDNVACVRLRIQSDALEDHVKTTTEEKEELFPAVTADTKAEPDDFELFAPSTEEASDVSTQEKEKRLLDTGEKEMLRQSFVHKTSAAEYIREIGGDVLDEIRDLESMEREWSESLHNLEGDLSAENLLRFADGVLGVYIRAINNLFEFTALAYALSALGAFLKENAGTIVSEPSKAKMLVMLLEHLGSDLASWREHVFGLQDTADIHYLDSSFFSSCMQIEGIISNKEVASDDDNDIEFF